MDDDQTWARPPDEQGQEPDATAEPQNRRWVLGVLLAVLVCVVLGGGWVVAALEGAGDFDDELGDSGHSTCDGELTIDDVRPQAATPDDLPPELDDVAAAFETFFGQDRWSYTEVEDERSADGPAGDLRISVDGEVFERRYADGFVGMIRPGAGVARYEGERFWVPVCVSGVPEVLRFKDADCVERDDEGATVRVTWAALRATSCAEAALRFSATLERGRLTSWTMELEGGRRYTATVAEPVELSWPSPVWVVPSWLPGVGS